MYDRNKKNFHSRSKLHNYQCFITKKTTQGLVLSLIRIILATVLTKHLNKGKYDLKNHI